MNILVFPVRDLILMMDTVHGRKKHPQTNLYDPDGYWDFFYQYPVTIHILTLTNTNSGINDGKRKMHKYGNHTFHMKI